MSVQASCPACGGPVLFKIGSSVVTICEYCRSVVARGDRQLEDLGKVADVVDSGSPLQIGMKGRYEGVPFDLTGQAQLGHPAGGMWDEWYAAFSDGRWGWLAEAQGRFYMTFAQEPPDVDLPAFEKLEVGQRIDVRSNLPLLTIAEAGEARPMGARGEIPYRLTPGQTYHFADLSGVEGEFATIDYSGDTPTVYFGREVSLEDLGVPASARAAEREARRVKALHLNCPNCGGALELRAPDQTERVICPNCAGMLDVSQGNLRFLKALEKQKVTPVLPLGARGKLSEGEMTVIGFMVRSVKIEGVRYFWEEYLLYEPRIGFRWLVCSDDHWSYVTPVPPGEISLLKGVVATYKRKEFKLFQRAVARVEYVVGEFYWKVAVDEEVSARDYILPPEMLSCEVSQTGASREVNWSLGTYIDPKAVARAFAIRPLPKSSKIAPNQPFPYAGVYGYYVLLAVIALVVTLASHYWTTPHLVFGRQYQLKPTASADKGEEFFSEPFELKPRQNIRVTARSNVENSWVYVEGDLINDDTDAGLVQPFEIPVEYYHGIEDGEAWSEGNKEVALYLSAVPGGMYILRLEVQREVSQAPGSLQVRIEQGIPRWIYFFLFLGILGVIPALVILYHIYFEKRRWEDSSIDPDESQGPAGEAEDELAEALPAMDPRKQRRLRKKRKR